MRDAQGWTYARQSRDRLSRVALDGLDNPVKHGTLEDRTLSTHRIRIDPNDAVHAHLTWSAGAVPITGADVLPESARTCLLLGIAVVVLAGELQREQPLFVVTNDEHGAILALRVVFFIRHPRPHDLAGVGFAVEVGGVLDAGSAAKIPRIVGSAARGLVLKTASLRCSLSMLF